MDTTPRERMKWMAETILERGTHCATEEATKMALVPTLQDAFGFDVWNPREVVPEFRGPWSWQAKP